MLFRRLTTSRFPSEGRERQQWQRDSERADPIAWSDGCSGKCDGQGEHKCFYLTPFWEPIVHRPVLHVPHKIRDLCFVPCATGLRNLPGQPGCGRRNGAEWNLPGSLMEPNGAIWNGRTTKMELRVRSSPYWKGF